MLKKPIAAHAPFYAAADEGLQSFAPFFSCGENGGRTWAGRS